MSGSERSRRRKAKAKRDRGREGSRWWVADRKPPRWYEASQGFALRGLEFGTAQLFGPIEIVPILRRASRSDFRTLGCVPEGPSSSSRAAVGEVRWSLIPSGVVREHGELNFGARVERWNQQQLPEARPLAEVARRADRTRQGYLRFVPEDAGIWGFMKYLYAAPNVWDLEDHMGRVEMVHSRFDYWRTGTQPGGRVPGLAEALRVFEIVDDQVGSMVWIAGQLSGTLVLPHPDDYRSMHSSLLGGWYANTLAQHASNWASVPSHYRDDIEQLLEHATPRTVAELRELLTRMRTRGQTILDTQLEQALALALLRDNEVAYGPFSYYRVCSKLVRKGTNYIGELIERDGQVEYLQLMHLNHAQSRRAYLLSLLQDECWDLESVAERERCTVENLIARLANIGIHVHSREGSRFRFWVRV